jgi:hypothetical protein
MINRIWIDAHAFYLFARIQIILLIHGVIQEELGQPLRGVDLDFDGDGYGGTKEDAIY